MTIKQHIDAAIEGIAQLEARGTRTDADRELSLSVTHLEDAKMRLTRGLAKHAGIFNEVDLQTEAGIGRAGENFADNVQDNPDGGVARS